MTHLFWLPTIALLIGLLPLGRSQWTNFTSRLTQCGLATLLFTVCWLCWQLPTNARSIWPLLTYHNIQLNLAIGFDALTRVLLCFIFFISFIIYSYARNYLLSDQTRQRFLVQLSLVIVSVILLAMSANLFTAFVAWQLIGINLYLLLNHYHDDRAANKAAKKKFIINRLGDCCFLTAIVIAYQTQNTTLFAHMHVDSNTWLICSLIFVSIMTKSAQFPFHIWLPDTMETPTPVSALMHAGVINAGAILLTRMSQLFLPVHTLMLIICMIGFITAILGTAWMQQQADTKRQLAYSTMGQMGYMILQCGLGVFSAAIFHLIAHGFFKATLFLSAGETLKQPRPKHTDSTPFLLRIMLASIGTLAILTPAFHLAQHLALHLPWIIWGFIGLTTLSLLYHSTVQLSLVRIVFVTSMTLALLCFYVFLLAQFDTLLGHLDRTITLPNQPQFIIIIALLITQIWLWSPLGKRTNLQAGDHVEQTLRRFALNPFRWCGDIINRFIYRSYHYTILTGLFLLAIAAFVSGFINVFHHFIHPNISHRLIIGSLCLLIISAIIANRNRSLALLLFWLGLFELCFINIALFEPSHDIQWLALFHLINIGLVFIMMIMLLIGSKHMDARQQHHYHHNKLPWRLFYLGFAFLLMLGIPGTASFITEFYILNALFQHGVWITVLYLIGLILLAIVIMHTLQVYVFDSQHAQQLSKPIKPLYHSLFVVIIGLNILSGIHPAGLLNLLKV